MENNKKSLEELMYDTNMMVQRIRAGRGIRVGIKGGKLDQLLISLQENQSINSKDLSEALGITLKGMNRLLDRLEEAELVTLETVKEDKTLLTVQLTETGKKAARKAEQRKAEMDKVFDCLTEEEKNNLQSILNHLAENLEKELRQEDDVEELWGREALFGAFRFGDNTEYHGDFHGIRKHHSREGYLRTEMFCNRGEFFNRGGFQPECSFSHDLNKHHNWRKGN